MTPLEIEQAKVALLKDTMEKIAAEDLPEMGKYENWIKAGVERAALAATVQIFTARTTLAKLKELTRCG